MNAGIRAALETAQLRRERLVGIPDGFVGLAAGRTTELDAHQVDPAKGGACLRTSRVPEGMAPTELLERSLDSCLRLGIESLVVLGGNGSLGGLAHLASHLPCAGVPATIDNDLAGSRLSIGFDTARQTGVTALDGIRDTAGALPGRCFALRTLGGSSGHLALAIALAGFAHAVAVPEIDCAEDEIVARARICLEAAGHFLLVVSEGSPWSEEAHEMIPRRLGVRVRETVLGHAQRGGVPTAADRDLARRLTTGAVDLVRTGRSGAVVWDGNAPSVLSLAAASRPKPIDAAAYRAIWDSLPGST